MTNEEMQIVEALHNAINPAIKLEAYGAVYAHQLLATAQAAVAIANGISIEAAIEHLVVAITPKPHESPSTVLLRREHQLDRLLPNRALCR